MIRWTVLIVAALAVVVARPMDGRQQVFRGGVDAVVVTVVVRDKDRPVRNLTSADFQLLDNGVAQEISSTTTESVPVDVTLVLDTSESLQGEAFAKLKRDIQAMAALLKPDDRVRLVTFASRVVDVVGLQPGNTPLPLETLSAGGSTSLQNGLATALMIAPTTDRPQLAFAATDGYGSPSFIDPRRLVKLAAYSSTALYVALVPPPTRMLAGDIPRNATQPFGYNQGFVVAPPRGPHNIPYREALKETVTAAGGVLYDARPDDSLPGLFRTVLQDFRTSYVLRYTPRGVTATGWHEVVVTVPKRSNLVVRARRGYERN